MNAGDITLRDIVAARHRLRPHLAPSPLRQSPWLSAERRATVLLKLESLHPTGSFKIRGALHAMIRLAERDRNRIVVTASAGNHGQAMALAGRMLGMRTVVFTPAGAPATKKRAIEHHGAELHDDAADYDEAEHRARELAARTGAIYLSPYNDRDVIAGAGTVALELIEALPMLELVVVPVGGGGLASGIGIALSHAAPQVAVIGVEAEASTAFVTSLERGEITRVDVRDSLADGLTGNLEPGATTFDYIRRYVERIVTVSEDDLGRAIRGLAAEEHLIAEGAGAAAAAAVLAAGLVRSAQRIAVIVSGGNIDLDRFTGVLRSA